MNNLIKKISAFLLAAGIAVTVSGCGILKTTRNIIKYDETQTQSSESVSVDSYSFATLTSSGDVLEGIPYIGDRGMCKMDKAMALAYKDAIESMPEQPKTEPVWGERKDYNLHALLADPADDGMPILITLYVFENSDKASEDCENDHGYPHEVAFWEYRDGKANRIDIIRPDYDNGFGRIGNKTYYRNIDFHHDVGPKRTGVYYLIENATVSLKHTVDLYEVQTSQGDRDGYGTLPDGVSYGYDPEELKANGWRVEGNENGSIAYLFIHNGKNVTDTYSGYMHDEYMKFYQRTKIVHANDANYHLEIMTDKGTNMAEKLEKYSKSAGRPSYRYSQVAQNLTDEVFGGIISAVKGIISGSIGEIYKLSDDLYYVTVYVDDEFSGGVLLKNTNGGKSWRAVSSDSKPMTEPELDGAVETDLRASNITIDTASENAEEALKNAIRNVDGTTVNDTAKNSIADYISNCITQESKQTVKASKNTVKIKDKLIKKAVEKANEKKSELLGDIEKEGVVLNKGIYTNILIECEKIDDSKDIRIVFDDDTDGFAEEPFTLTVKFSGTPYSVKLESSNLTEIQDKNIIISKKDEKTYTIKFTDKDGNIIEDIGIHVAFTLPAQNKYCTVQLEYKGGTANWGGQYDSNNEVLIFETSYSGTYTVLENKAKITDIDGLNAEQKKAVEFLVSKGYMQLEGDKFNPDSTLTRYQFTQALVGMFFALDNEVKTTFTDVPKDSEFYSYVASAQKDDIVEGFTDTEFAGDMDMTTEQMVALAGRTLIKYKGYVTPEDAGKYLDTFSDRDKISDWARELVAISVREGLVDRTTEFGPQTPINRKQAAVILYRLFLLLYEIEPEQSAVTATTDVVKIIIVSICSVVIVACVVLIIILLKKRNRGKKSDGNNI